MSKPDIKTAFVYPPIPIRCFDWCAVDDNTYDGPGSPCGWGETEQEAIADLLEVIAEREECKRVCRETEIEEATHAD